MHLPLLNNTLIRLMGTASENCAQTQTALKKSDKSNTQIQIATNKNLSTVFFTKKL